MWKRMGDEENNRDGNIVHTVQLTIKQTYVCLDDDAMMFLIESIGTYTWLLVALRQPFPYVIRL